MFTSCLTQRSRRTSYIAQQDQWTARSVDTTSLNLEPVSSHAGLVLLDQGLALLSRVIGFREQHAVIPVGLFGLADAAGLEMVWSDRLFRGPAQCAQQHTLGFSVGVD